MTKLPRWLFLAGVALTRLASAQFIPTGTGPYNYSDPANWTNGSINNVFSQTLTVNQTILLPSDLSFTPSVPPRFSFGGSFDLTLRGISTSPSILHFTGSSVFDSVVGGRTMNIGSPTSQHQVEVDLNSVANFDVADSDTLVLWNRVGGAILRKFGAGTMILHGTNTYTGGTQIGGGILEVSADSNLGAVPSVQGDNIFISGDPFKPGTLRLGASFDIDPKRSIKLQTYSNAIDTNGFNTTFAGDINGPTGNSVFYKQGAGELRLKGQVALGGTIVVNGGTLAWDYTANNSSKVDAAGTVAVSNRSILSLTGNNSAPTVQTVGSLFVGGSIGVRVAGGTLQSVVLNVGNFSRGAGSVDFTLAESGGIHLDTPAFVGVFGYATVGGSDWAMRDAGGYVVRLPSYDIDSLAAAANSDLTANQTISVSTAINSLRFNTPSAVGVTLDAAARLTIGAAGQTGGILVTGQVGGNAVSIAGGQLTANTRDLAVIQNNTTQPMTISSRIVDGAASISLTKSGPGVLILQAANTYTGTTYIADGTLRLGGAGRLPDLGMVSLNELATLDLNGTSQTIGPLIGGTGSNVLLGGGTLSITISGNATYQFDGVISGEGGVSKLGIWPQILRGPNTYTGPTIIEAGSIELAGNGSLPESTTLIINGTTYNGLRLGGRSQKVASLLSANPLAYVNGPGTLILGAGNGTYAGTFAAALTLVKDGAGTTTVLTGSSSYTGGTTLKAGTLAIAGDAALGGAPFSPATNVTFEGGVLQLNASFSAFSATRGFLINSAEGAVDTNGFSTAISGQIAGPGRLTKYGAGALTLGAANTFGGGVTVNGGTLIAGGDVSLGASGTVVRLNSGALSSTGTIPRNIILGIDGGGLGSGTAATYSGVVSGAGALSVNTSGSVTLNAENTFSGGTQIGPSGALLVTGSNRSLGSGPVSVLSGGLLGISTAANMAPGLLVPLRPGAALAVLNTGVDPAAIIDPDPANTTGGILALGAPVYDRALNMAAIGNGRLFLSAFGSATYTATTLGANADGIYRLGTSTATGTNILTIGGTDNVLTGPRSVVIGSATAAGNATVALSNANDFTGGTTLAGGTLSLGNNFAIGDGPLTITGGALKADVAVTMNNPIFIGGDFAIGASTFPMFVNGPVDLGGGASKITLSPTVQINGRISNGALYKSGSGTLILATANDYAGGTTILGTLRSLAQGALGTGPVVLGASLVFDGVPQTFANPIAITGIGSPVSLGFNTSTSVTGDISCISPFAATLNLGGTSPNATISGAISDGARMLALSKSGSGTIALSGANSYRGGTTFGAGTIAATSDTNLGAALNTEGNLVFTGGTLRYDAAFTLNPGRYFELRQNSSTAPTIDTNGFDVTIGNAIRGNATSGIAGRFIKGGGGKLTLTGTNSYSNATLNAGTLQFNSIASMGNGTVSMTAGTVVAAGFPIDQTFLNKLAKSSTATVALASNSANALDFTGANWRLGATGSFTYSGTLTPNGSTYRLGGGGGTLTLPSSILSGARSLEISGAGTVVLSSFNSYGGATNIDGGTLKLGPSGAVPGTSAIALANGGTFDASSLALGFTLATTKSLLGTGRVLGRFTASSGSTVSPGSAAAPFGELSLAEFTLRGRYLADIDALGHHDLLTIAGNLDLSSATDGLTVNVIDSLSGETVLATYSGTLTGVFDSLTLPPGTALDYGTGANSQIRLVPEPASGVLMLTGALAFARRRARGSANFR